MFNGTSLQSSRFKRTKNKTTSDTHIEKYRFLLKTNLEYIESTIGINQYLVLWKEKGLPGILRAADFGAE